MRGSAWHPPASEVALGLEFYATHTAPLRGRTKADPEDFDVREISSYPVPDASGAYTVLRVRSQDWEQHELAARLAQRLRLPPHALSWAGTKDRRAVAERLFSYRGTPPDLPVELPNATVLEAYRARDGLSLGHHYGNAFDLRLTGLEGSGDAAMALLEATRQELRSAGGFPNFFGLQRFGEVRPVTHLVGRWLVKGRPEEAVDTYLTWVSGDGDVLGATARRGYAEHHDPARALQEFPAAFRFERQLLDRLARGHSPERALGALSRELRTLFLHAYQSLLFNRWASERPRIGQSFWVPEEGDWILRVARDGTIPLAAPVEAESDNLAECRELVSRGRAVVAGPLVGYETPALKGPGGEALERLLVEEGVRREQFKLPRSPGLASRGTWRPLGVSTPPLAIALCADSRGLAEEPASVRMRFSLPRGCYATVLVREFLKSGAT